MNTNTTTTLNIEYLRRLMLQVEGTVSRRFVAHPCWKDVILSAAKLRGIPLDGAQIDFIDVVPKFTTKWEFPKERFVEYEPSDEAWCRYFRLGCVVETEEPLIYSFQNELFSLSGYLEPEFVDIPMPTFSMRGFW